MRKVNGPSESSLLYLVYSLVCVRTVYQRFWTVKKMVLALKFLCRLFNLLVHTYTSLRRSQQKKSFRKLAATQIKSCLLSSKHKGGNSKNWKISKTLCNLLFIYFTFKEHFLIVFSIDKHYSPIISYSPKLCAIGLFILHLKNIF